MDEKILRRFWAKVNKDGPPHPYEPGLGSCWQWIGGRMNSWGYGGFGVGGSPNKPHLAHRVSWLIHRGEWPAQQVLHSCDNRLCVNPAHLREGTHADNMRDRSVRGRTNSTRLKESDIPTIRARCASGETHASVASSYGVSRATIDDLISGRTWRHTIAPPGGAAGGG